jgi:molybdopterin-containing oxidoreductase family membrane subunit
MFWGMVLCNVAAPMLFWSPRLRTNTAALLAVSVLVLIGMWLERFVIIVQSLTHDFLPKSWSFYEPTIIDGTLYFGTISLFLFCFLLFLRFLPFIPLTEVKELVAEHPDA